MLKTLLELDLKYEAEIVSCEGGIMMNLRLEWATLIIQPIS